MTDLTTPAKNIVRTQNHYYELFFAGLTPNTKHTIKIDDVDYGFATKQKGKDYGADLISDVNGRIDVGVLVEIAYPRNRNQELPKRNSLQYQNEQLNSTNKNAVNVVKNYKVFEVVSGNGLSKAQFIMTLNTVLTADSVRTLYSIE